MKEGRLSTDSVVLDAELLATALPGLEQICAEMLQEEGYNFISLLKNLCAVYFKVKPLVFLYSEMVHKRNGEGTQTVDNHLFLPNSDFSEG